MRLSNMMCLLAAHGLYISTVSAVLDRSRSQFKAWFPTIETYSKEHWMKEDCSKEFEAYFDDNLNEEAGAHRYLTDLMNCILNAYREVNKANMAVTAILLALLPGGLVQFGPSMAQISLLSTRRPLLAMLLGFGLMSPNPTEFEYEAILEKASSNNEPLVSLRILDGCSYAAKALVSFVEYGIGLAATGNLFWEVYRFTYHAISLAPMVVYIHGLPEISILFGWAFLNLPIYLLSFGVFALILRRTTPGNDFVGLVVDELTPCGQGRNHTIKRRDNKLFLQNLLGTAVRVIGGLHIILGTVLIGSIVLIPLADSLPVIYTFVFAALSTRAVLVYELNGLTRKTTVEKEKDMGKMPWGVDAESRGLLCVNCIPLNQRDMEE